MLCTAQREVHRTNAAAAFPESYFWVNLFIPLVESDPEDMKSHFSSAALNVFCASFFLAILLYLLENAVKDNYLACKYRGLLQMKEDELNLQIKVEYCIWTAK